MRTPSLGSSAGTPPNIPWSHPAVPPVCLDLALAKQEAYLAPRPAPAPNAAAANNNNNNNSGGHASSSNIGSVKVSRAAAASPGVGSAGTGSGTAGGATNSGKTAVTTAKTDAAAGAGATASVLSGQTSVKNTPHNDGDCELDRDCGGDGETEGGCGIGPRAHSHLAHGDLAHGHLAHGHSRSRSHASALVLTGPALRLDLDNKRSPWAVSNAAVNASANLNASTRTSAASKSNSNSGGDGDAGVDATNAVAAVDAGAAECNGGDFDHAHDDEAAAEAEAAAAAAALAAEEEEEARSLHQAMQEVDDYGILPSEEDDDDDHVNAHSNAADVDNNNKNAVTNDNDGNVGTPGVIGGRVAGDVDGDLEPPESPIFVPATAAATPRRTARGLPTALSLSQSPLSLSPPSALLPLGPPHLRAPLQTQPEQDEDEGLEQAQLPQTQSQTETATETQPEAQGPTQSQSQSQNRLRSPAARSLSLAVPKSPSAASAGGLTLKQSGTAKVGHVSAEPVVDVSDNKSACSYEITPIIADIAPGANAVDAAPGMAATPMYPSFSQSFAGEDLTLGIIALNNGNYSSSASDPSSTNSSQLKPRSLSQSLTHGRVTAASTARASAVNTRTGNDPAAGSGVFVSQPSFTLTPSITYPATPDSQVSLQSQGQQGSSRSPLDSFPSFGDGQLSMLYVPTPTVGDWAAPPPRAAANSTGSTNAKDAAVGDSDCQINSKEPASSASPADKAGAGAGLVAVAEADAEDEAAAEAAAAAAAVPTASAVAASTEC